MNVDAQSSLQAVFAAVLLQRGRHAAEQWFTAQMVIHGPSALETEQHVYRALWAAGVGCEVLGVVDSASDRVYARALRDGDMFLGVYKAGLGPDDSVWGIMYRKPCKCAGLALLHGHRPRPVQATPHREVYFDCAIRLVKPTRVYWPLLVDLPTLV